MHLRPHAMDKVSATAKYHAQLVVDSLNELYMLDIVHHDYWLGVLIVLGYCMEKMGLLHYSCCDFLVGFTLMWNPRFHGGYF